MIEGFSSLLTNATITSTKNTRRTRSQGVVATQLLILYLILESLTLLSSQVCNSGVAETPGVSAFISFRLSTSSPGIPAKHLHVCMIDKLYHESHGSDTGFPHYKEHDH